MKPSWVSGAFLVLLALYLATRWVHVPEAVEITLGVMTMITGILALALLWRDRNRS
ncbi:hypothetical protein [Pilimelia columellifera]|uniref:Uncharacterized protein n=1 Tax=Pilimelia columellifera subsp. columellifera TaxID=706583 RepID=A0ABP6AW12_9ACTN